MVRFLKASRRWDVPRVAASALGLAVLLLVAAYAFAAIESPPPTDGVVAALAAVVVAGGGLLYAWRLRVGGIVD
jgi:membrane associated rhomboid family serine protease